MSSPAQLAANIANAQHSTGPRTEAGKAASSQNAVKSGLFATSDCIRPGEESLYQELDEALHNDLVPEGQLEYNLVDEIRRAMWRLRRCGEVEAAMAETCAETCAQTCAETGPGAPILDPMQIEATAKLQLSVDRARSQCHRLLHKCTAELRKFQTERHVRNETLDEGTDVGQFGLAETRAFTKAVHEVAAMDLTIMKRGTETAEMIARNAIAQATALPADFLSTFSHVEKPATKQTQAPPATPRNAPCPCNSGQKYKRCCGKDAAPLLHAA